MLKTGTFWLAFMLAIAVQFLLIAAAVEFRCGCLGTAVEGVYSPAAWVTETFFSQSEENVGAEILFIPPLILIYAFALGALASKIRKIHEA